MRIYTSLTTSLSAFAAYAIAQSQPSRDCGCPADPQSDATVLEFAFALEKFSSNFYAANGDFTVSKFSSFPRTHPQSASSVNTSADLSASFAGIETQTQLAVTAIQQLASEAGAGYGEPTCDYSYPRGLQDGKTAVDFVWSAYNVEAVLCGAFIGLADYTQSPRVGFLMARLSAQHGVHAGAISRYLGEVPFSADAIALTPAYTPSHVLQKASRNLQPGILGDFIPSSCVKVPQAPCGGEVHIGNLNSDFQGAGMGSKNGSGTTGTEYSSASASSSSSAPTASGFAGNSSLPQQQVGNAAQKLEGSLAALVAATLVGMVGYI